MKYFYQNPNGYLTSKLIPKIIDYWQLMRLNKPIGILLLLWPTLIALHFAANGKIFFKEWWIFVLEVIICRSAGCILNDYADKDFDGFVKRTKLRLLATKRVSTIEAKLLIIILLSLAAILTIFLNNTTKIMAIFALLLMSAYPFTKRFTYWPQAFLGITFSWSIPMAFTALEQLSVQYITVFLLLTINFLWVIIYDTQYAMVDKDDDLKINIKSTAILFGKFDYIIISLLSFFMVLLLLGLGWHLKLGIYYYLGISIVSAIFIYQHKLICKGNRQKCFIAFLNNTYIGGIIYLGILLDGFI